MVPGDIFIDDPDPNSYPVVWSSPGFLNLENGLRELHAADYSGNNAPYGQFFAPGVNQPYTHANVPTGPVVDQNKNYLRYEVTVNQTYFNYILNFQYYSADKQKEAVKNYLDYAWAESKRPPGDDPRYFQPVPTGVESYVPTTDYAQQGLVEVKAAWKVLQLEGDNPDIPQRYFRRMMKMPLPGGGSEEKLVGLVGFHIHRVTPNGHLPSTFEHVDNVELFPNRFDPLPLPRTPSLNPGRRPRYDGDDFNHKPFWPSYPNGYEVDGLSGQPGIIPKAFLKDDVMPPVEQRPTINISRSTPIPLEVRKINREYQERLRNSVWRYYQLIGTQNRSGTENNPSVEDNPFLGPGIPNRDLGPGIPGPQFSNTTNLVNTTLESFTQPGFSCARCHINAFPQGVGAFPPYEDQFEPLHVMSFILLSAKPESPPQ
jgi:hypothetical protein